MSNTLYAVNATAIDIGISEIELQIKFISLNSNKHVKTVARVDIINPVILPLPTYVSLPDTKSGILLIPPKSGHYLQIQNM